MSPNSRKVDDEELDLSSIGRNISNVVDGINAMVFRIIRFFVRNAIIIGILFIVGVAAGIYLDRVQRTYDHQVIVSPHFGSTDYMYGKVHLLEAKIRERDTMFLKKAGFSKPDRLLEMEIKPVVDVYRFVNQSDRNFELLKLMSEDGDIKKVVEEPTTSKHYTYHIISFSTRNMTDRAAVMEPLMKYLNDSQFFTEIQREYVNNVKVKIAQNEATLRQIDAFLDAIGRSSSEAGKPGNLVYINENTQLNDVLETKNDLIREQGNHRIDLVSLDKIVKENSTILNIENKKSVNGKMKIILPLLLIGIFIAINRFRKFYRSQSIKYNQA